MISTCSPPTLRATSASTVDNAAAFNAGAATARAGAHIMHTKMPAAKDRGNGKRFASRMVPA